MIQKWISTARKTFGKYKYAALVILLGVGILLIPGGAEKPSADAPLTETISAQREKQSLQEGLKTLLMQMHGVGNAEVLLSLDTGAENSFWQDRENDGTQTVFSQLGNEKTPTLLRQQYPKYRGAVIVCEGAETARVQLAVKEAVSNLTGLGMDKITVLKMKGQ